MALPLRACLISLAAALLVSCGTSAPAAPSSAAASAGARPSQQPVIATIKVGVQARPDQAPFELAYRRGYFEQQRLQIQTVQINSGAQMVPALSTNQVQVGNGAPSAALFNALNRDVNIRLVADWAHVGSSTDTTIAIVARKDLMDSGAIRSAADLKGRSIGQTTQGNIAEMLLAQAMERAGANVSQANVEYFQSIPDALSALANGKVDAAGATEPLVTQAVEQGIGKVLVAGGEVIPGAELSVLQYSPQFATEQPEAATRFMVAFLRGARDYYDAFHLKKNRDETIKLLTQYLSVKDPHVWDVSGPEYVDLNGQINVEDLENQAKFYAQQGTLKGQMPNIRSFVDTKFAEAAVKQLGRR
ncbi:MAG TPA: ABC transporter substrate-binding protein [Chloroflexota bacterium]|nr:ABC transporter substrate-binding protein [Chloroflexota bacterium]